MLGFFWVFLGFLEKGVESTFLNIPDNLRPTYFFNVCIGISSASETSAKTNFKRPKITFKKISSKISNKNPIKPNKTQKNPKWDPMVMVGFLVFLRLNPPTAPNLRESHFYDILTLNTSLTEH